MQLLSRPSVGLRWLVLLFIGTCLCCLFLPAQAKAETGTIADDANVLDVAAVKHYTDSISYTVDIFTTTIFQGSNDDFDASVQALTSSQSDVLSAPCNPTKQVGCELYGDSGTTTMPPSTSNYAPIVQTRSDDANESIEIGINVKSRHIAIYSGDQVTIPSNHYQNAINAFAAKMHTTHDNYTQATIDALNALESSGDRFWNGLGHVLPFLLFGGFIVGSIVLYALFRNNSDDGDGGNSYYRRRYNNWNSGSGFGGGGSSSGGGGGGGGASGNF